MKHNLKYKLRVSIAAMFAILGFLIFAIKIADMPHFIFGVPHASIRWTEVFIEFMALMLVGLPFFYLVGKWESEAQETEEKIEQSRKLLYVILEGSPAAILFIKNHKVLWAGKSVEDILGWPVEKWLSEPSTAFCYPSKEEFETIERDVIYKDIARKGRVAYEYDYVHKDGHLVPAVVRMQALNKNNLDEGFIFSIIDNTERKKAEDVIKKLNESLEQKVAERTKELAEKINELERFKDATVNRELRMKELRDEIAALKEKLQGKADPKQ